MGDKTINVQEKATEIAKNTSDVAKNIWLAGLGAYGKALDGASERYDNISKESTRMFDDLVAKGKNIEDETQGKISDAKAKSTSSLDERIVKVRQNLGFGEFSKEAKIEELSAQVADLSEKLDQVLAAVSGAKKAAPKTRSASAKAE